MSEDTYEPDEFEEQTEKPSQDRLSRRNMPILTIETLPLAGYVVRASDKEIGDKTVSAFSTARELASWLQTHLHPLDEVPSRQAGDMPKFLHSKESTMKKSARGFLRLVGA